MITMHNSTPVVRAGERGDFCMRVVYGEPRVPRTDARLLA
jgi:hypothetical protein